MIRRQFDLDGKQVLVTYDQTTDTMHVGTRDNSFDEWSTPLPLIDTDDDPVGRTGGPGSLRGALDLTSDQSVIERLRAIVNEADNQSAPAEGVAGEQVHPARPNQTRRPAPDTTAMQEDPRTDRRGS